jgi:hypothetical protein
MINFEEAKKIAKKHITDECGLIEKYTIEKPYGWYFSAQSKRFIETGNFLDMTIRFRRISRRTRKRSCY